MSDEIIQHYEQEIREENRITTGIGQLELVRTQEVLRRHLPTPPAAILDIGGATGVHASWLAADGYRVHIVDLTPRHVEKARADLASLGWAPRSATRAISMGSPIRASMWCSSSVRSTTS